MKLAQVGVLSRSDGVIRSLNRFAGGFGFVLGCGLWNLQ